MSRTTGGRLAVNELERRMVGTVLATGGKALDLISLAPSDFSSPVLEELWDVSLRMHSRGEPVDAVTLGLKFPLSIPGVPVTLLHELMAEGGNLGSASYYAAQVTELAGKRRLADAGRRITQLAESASDAAHVVEEARKLVDSTTDLHQDDLRPMSETIEETIDMLSEPSRFTPTPWDDLNHLIGGWKPGAFYMIGARPGVGKTIIGLEAALDLCMVGSVLFCSMEMPRNELQQRAISSLARVSQRDLERRTITETGWAKISDAMNSLKRELYIDDRGAMNPTSIRSAARTIARKGRLSGVVIDYLQLMSPHRGDRRPRQEIVSSFSRELKLLAKELDVPVIALSQLNRASEGRTDKMPSIADLRESGALEQDSDVVFLLHRDQEKSPDVLDVAVAKNRHGIQGAVKLTFEGAYSRLADKKWTPYGASERAAQ